MATDFTLPDFLQGTDVETIHSEMLDSLPYDIDASEGNHAWNLTRPTALETAQMLEFYIPNILRQMFTKWATGSFLDLHAEERKITRKSAAYASGTLTITGKAGTVIPESSVFATAAVNDTASVNYITLESATIPSTGSVDIQAQCTVSGLSGNTAKGTIVLKVSNIDGITGVTNAADFTGGTEEEDDESLRERVEDYDQGRESSYVGNKADYKRWAKSVAGVGNATVIAPEDKSGKVTIVLTDSNGDPATALLCTTVYNHIMRPDDEYERLAPPNAVLYCIPPSTIAVTVTATVELDGTKTLAEVKTAYLSALAKYMATAGADGEVKYTKICSLLSAVSGVNDYDHTTLKMNDGEANIPIAKTEMAVVSADGLTLTEGNVS